MEDTISSMVDTINKLEAENAALKAKVGKFTSYNKQSTPLLFNCPPVCSTCGHCHKFDEPCRVM
jgi:hypothetical protein